jgi:5-methylcytosine-specific restriction enzyme A
MPQRPPRPCSHPGCSALVQSGRCPSHQTPNLRPSARRRGYDRRWEAVRAAVLAEELACTDCGSTDRPHVDHIDGNPFNRSRANLRRLCHSCHSKRTAKDQAFGRARPGWQCGGSKTHPRPAPPLFA